MMSEPTQPGTFQGILVGRLGFIFATNLALFGNTTLRHIRALPILYFINILYLLAISAILLQILMWYVSRNMQIQSQGIQISLFVQGMPHT